MKWKVVEALTRSMIQKSKGTLSHGSLFPVVATVCGLGSHENLKIVMLSGTVILDSGGRLIMPIMNWSDYRHFTVPCDKYEKLDEVDFVTFVKRFDNVIVVTWVESKTVKDTAEYYGLGSYHPECKRAFKSERWTLEPEHVKDISLLRDALCQSQG